MRKPLISGEAHTQVQSDLALAWRVDAAVVSNVASSWRITTSVSASLGVSWQILAPLSPGGWARLPYEHRLIPEQPRRMQVASALSMSWAIHRNDPLMEQLAAALVIAGGDTALAMALNEALGGAR